jgi:ribosome-associated toxin RatA of RatAB toxin-antitoxin module
MATVVNKIDINASPETVFLSCVAIEQWPRIIPNCVSISKKEIGHDEVLMEMTVLGGAGTHIVKSHRKYQRENHVIDFRLLSAPEPIGSMSGSWVVKTSNSGSQLIVTHIVTLRPDEETQPSRDDTLDYVCREVHRNTENALSALKQWSENAVPTEAY